MIKLYIVINTFKVLATSKINIAIKNINKLSDSCKSPSFRENSSNAKEKIMKKYKRRNSHEFKTMGISKSMALCPPKKKLEDDNMLSEFDAMSVVAASNRGPIHLKEKIDTSESKNVEFKTYQKLMNEFFTCASLCHQCVVEKGFNGDIIYQGQSPDEIAICKGIQKAGFEFRGTNSDGIAEVFVLDQNEVRQYAVIMVILTYSRSFLSIRTERDTQCS